MNPNSWQFDRQELNALAMSLHTPTQRLGWGRRLYRFEVAGQGYWLKYQSLSEHAALINGFDAELSFYQHALAMLQLPKFLPEVQILENFEFHSEQVKVALILKNVPSLLMANPRQLSRDYVIHIIFKMLNAVEELHQMGWIHADLKASHFLLDGSTCKLIDFEQSQRIGEISCQKALTATPRYMAPELFHGEAKTVQTDLYALGIILLEWLTDQRLQAASYQDWAYLHCQSLKIALPESFQGFSPLLHGLLAKQKSQRWQNIMAAKRCLMTEIE